MMLPAFPDPRYEVQVQNQPTPVSLAFEPTLFNSAEYLAHVSQPGNYSFYLVRKSTGKVHGLFHVQRQDQQAFSPFRAPFGSMEISPDLTLKLTEDFARTILDFLKTNGVSEVTMKHYPFCYGQSQSALVVNSWLYLDLQISLSQVNHHLPVSEISFEELLHQSERRRLQKCRKHGFTFQREEASFLPEAYDFIAACRQEKKKPLSLSEPQLQALFELFPDRYLIFSVKKGQELAAVTVAVKVRSDILLTVYPASPYAFNNFSPAVMLNEGLYGFCQADKIGMLDYGISGVKEDPHYSLMHFKERMGGLASLKLTFTGKLN